MRVMPFKDALFMRKLIHKMKKGDSPVVLITGQPNAGKTWLGALMAETIIREVFKSDWDMEKNTIFDMDQMAMRFIKAKKTVLLLPEAGHGLAFDRWFDPENRFFDKIVQTQRIKRNCYILNIPNAKDLGSRHRRKIYMVIEVFNKKRLRVWINRTKSSKLYGNEYSTISLGEFFRWEKPKCHKKLKEHDIKNKEDIEEELVEDQLFLVKSKEVKKRIKKFACPECASTQIRFNKKSQLSVCQKCGFEWKMRKKL